MTSKTDRNQVNTILLVGASRGIGHAMAGEFLERGWHVIGTVRGPARTALHDLAEKYEGRVAIEALDMTHQDEIDALRARLSDRRVTMLFVNAGTANTQPDDTIAQISTDEFIHVMVTNALSPMRVIEALQDLVTPEGLIGVMSSGQGSIGNNEKGGREVYRGTKAALNMYMRSYAARRAADLRPMVLMAPGWIKTALGGDNAPFTLEETVPMIVDVLLSQQGMPGLRYLDREGKTVPW